MKIKEIKEQARISLKGNLFKAILITIFYTIISILIQMLIKNITNIFSTLNANEVLTIITIFINIAFFPFSYGVIASLIDISKGEKVSFTNFINISILNYTKIVKLFLSILIRLLIHVAFLVITLILATYNFNNPAINLFALILFIASCINLFIQALSYALALFVYYDNSTTSCKEILNNSKKIIKRNKFKYLLLLFSYILWFAFFALINKAMTILGININIINYTINILTACITPVITVSQYIFYDNLADKILEKTEKNEELKEAEK